MMTEVWDIVYDLEEKSPCLFVKNGERWKNEGKIKEIKTTNEVGVVMVSLITGHHKGKSDSLNPNNPKFRGTSKSRTKFLEAWKKFVAEFPESQQNSRGAVGSENAQIEPSREDSSNSLTTGSIDITSEVEKKLVGRCVEVHIRNLVAPHSSRCLREIDRTHVDALKESFKVRPDNNLIFFGIIFEEHIEMKDFQINGKVTIETIGGNHSRIALQELFDEGLLKTPIIYMNLYKNVTNTEALKLGFDHNVCHELGKPTSPEELMFLFRKELLKLMTEEEVVSPQPLNLRLWKEACASILGITKTKLHNVYHCMLALCLSSKEGWAHIEGFVSAWNRNRIKRRPKGSIKKTHFTKMSGTTEKDRNSLLQQLVTGEIDWIKFNKSCAPKKKAADRQTDQAVNQSTFETSDENSSNLSETETVQTNQKTYKVHVSTEQEKRIREQKETEAGLKKQISDLEKVIQLQAADVQRLEMCERKVHDLEDENKVLLTENKMQSEKIKSLRNQIIDLKRDNTFKDVLEEQNKKLMDEVKQLKETLARSNSLQKRKTVPENTEQNLQENKEKKQKTLSETPTETTLPFDKMTMAVVEYNNKAYFGEMTEGDKFTFAKMPFGKLDNPINWDQVKEGSFLINPRDKVKLDPKYIICNVKCRKTKNKIVLNDDQMNFIKTKLSKHINQ